MDGCPWPLAATIDDEHTRGTTQGQLVRLMAEAGDFDRAQSTASTVATPSARVRALAEDNGGPDPWQVLVPVNRLTEPVSR